MGIASIKFAQGVLTPPAGQALQGVAGAPVTCTNADDTNINTWVWLLTQVPPGSALVPGTLSHTAAAAFTPDAPGSYLIQLTTTDIFHVVATDNRVFAVPQDAVYNRIIPPFTAQGDAINIGGQLRGWSPYMEGYLNLLDRIRDFAPTAPTAGQVPVWNNGTKRYEPGVISSFTAGGDLSGSDVSQTVIGLLGRPLNVAAPGIGQYLGWDGTHWTASTVVSFTAGTDLSGTNTNQTVIGLQGRSLAATAPTDRQILAWIAANNDWEPTDPSTVIVSGLVYEFAVLASDIGGYNTLMVAASGVETDSTVSINSVSGLTLIKSFASRLGSPDVSYIPAGLWEFEYYTFVSAASGTTLVTFQVYKRASGGAETLLFSVTDTNDTATSVAKRSLSYSVPADIILAPTDRIVVKVLAQTTSVPNVTVHFVYDGTTHPSHVHTSIPGAAVPVGGDLTGTTGNAQVAKISSVTGPGFIGIDASDNVVLEANMPLPKELSFVAGVASTPNSTPTRIGSRKIDLSAFPSTLADGRTLHAAIIYDFETTAGTASIQLQNITDAETVTSSLQTTVSLSSTEVSVPLTVGAAAGNLKTGKLYEVQLYLTGASSLDRAICTNARLVITYS